MNRKHRQTLISVFADPVRANISWQDIEAMLKALGVDRDEGSGSRVRFSLNGVRSVFHRPHSGKEVDKGAVKDMRRFLMEAGIDKDEV